MHTHKYEFSTVPINLEPHGRIRLKKDKTYNLRGAAASRAAAAAGLPSTQVSDNKVDSSKSALTHVSSAGAGSVHCAAPREVLDQRGRNAGPALTTTRRNKRSATSTLVRTETSSAATLYGHQSLPLVSSLRPTQQGSPERERPSPLQLTPNTPRVRKIGSTNAAPYDRCCIRLCRRQRAAHSDQERAGDHQHQDPPRQIAPAAPAPESRRRQPISNGAKRSDASQCRASIDRSLMARPGRQE
ncbi:hypothetical protein HPB50_024531 [Hyalomma asiaticum]|uniref:Uncharacterized protein n=1 Tax=Hyalomma asiaticum TaxID=266040 RepID=A0ACB7SKZ3_HYAAI|nr:hypothetical protein HPB50_024531 [Hyalomma asiaticum]